MQTLTNKKPYKLLRSKFIDFFSIIVKIKKRLFFRAVGKSSIEKKTTNRFMWL